MSTTQFTTLVDAIVARHAPDAVRRRRERATRDRHITIAPDRFQPGQARITGSLPVTDAAAFNAQLDAMAASVHPDDPRNKRQRRVDAMIALAAHLDTLPCRCPHCAPVPKPVDLDDTVNEPEMERPSAAVESDDTMRSPLADARRSFVTTGIHADAAAESRYTRAAQLQNLVRCGELCCTFPGCNQPVWTTDLDHTTPFDHHSPQAGGATTQRNLKPLCRFHHRIKTFGMWRDYQDEYLTAWFQSPTGHTFVGNAFNGRDLFGYLVPGRPPDHPARSTLAGQRETRTTTHRREIDAWNAANPPPF